MGVTAWGERAVGGADPEGSAVAAEVPEERSAAELVAEGEVPLGEGASFEQPKEVNATRTMM
jgi:hypothetical protein